VQLSFRGVVDVLSARCLKQIATPNSLPMSRASALSTPLGLNLARIVGDEQPRLAKANGGMSAAH
jgi:hypothetical protein